MLIFHTLWEMDHNFQISLNCTPGPTATLEYGVSYNSFTVICELINFFEVSSTVKWGWDIYHIGHNVRVPNRNQPRWVSHSLEERDGMLFIKGSSYRLSTDTCLCPLPPPPQYTKGNHQDFSLGSEPGVATPTALHLFPAPWLKPEGALLTLCGDSSPWESIIFSPF